MGFVNLHQLWHDESGILTIEWAMIVVVIVIGVLGVMAAIRDALVIETGEAAGAVGALDDGYVVNAPPQLTLCKLAGGSSATDLVSANILGFENDTTHISVGNVD